MMNDIFRNLIAEGIVVVYLDDILIFTKTKEEHAQAVRQMLRFHGSGERIGMEQKILSDICRGNRNGDQEKPIAKAAREL